MNHCTTVKILLYRGTKQRTQDLNITKIWHMAQKYTTGGIRDLQYRLIQSIQRAQPARLEYLRLQ